MSLVSLFQVDKGTAGLNGTDGETTTQGENGLYFYVCLQVQFEVQVLICFINIVQP